MASYEKAYYFKMKLRILSDLHFEFHHDGGNSFVQSQDFDFDVCVLAGDIDVAKNINKSLKLFADKFHDKHIVHVPGNHEYYNSTFEEVENLLKNIKEYDNLHILNNSSVYINDVKFVGSTLWFDHSDRYEFGDDDMNDFSLVGDIYNNISKASKDSREYLKNNVTDGCVVVTHHLPHWKSIHENYRGSSLNKYFLHNISDIVEDNRAKIWIHGHTHQSIDYVAGTTRVVCNPFGYVRHEQNANFNENLTIII